MHVACDASVISNAQTVICIKVGTTNAKLKCAGGNLKKSAQSRNGNGLTCWSKPCYANPRWTWNRVGVACVSAARLPSLQSESVKDREKRI
jgi:hypothetical protein